MPTYQYSCTECGHFLEVVQSFSDDSLTVCPECEGRLRKVFNAVGVVFKGSGFYRTDSRSGGSETAGSGSGGSKDAAPAASGSSTSSKESGSTGSASKDSSSTKGSTESSSSSTKGSTPKSA